MPYITVTANGEEIDRLELTGPITIGRTPECDLAIRDILLSRQHCRLEPVKNRDKHRWRLIDLGSRNGSHVNYKKVTNYVMVDGDTVRIGRTRLTFKTGPFTPMTDAPRKNRLVRPADPHEALSGTVGDFVYAEHDAGEEFDVTPSPVAGLGREPKVAGSSVPGELSQSWAAVATASAKPRKLARPMPRAAGEIAVGSRSSHTDLSLQASEKQLPFLQVVPAIPTRRRGAMSSVLIFAAGVAAATGVLMVSGWVMMK